MCVSKKDIVFYCTYSSDGWPFIFRLSISSSAKTTIGTYRNFPSQPGCLFKAAPVRLSAATILHEVLPPWSDLPERNTPDVVIAFNSKLPLNPNSCKKLASIFANLAVIISCSSRDTLSDCMRFSRPVQ